MKVWNPSRMNEDPPCATLKSRVSHLVQGLAPNEVITGGLYPLGTDNFLSYINVWDTSRLACTATFDPLYGSIQGLIIEKQTQQLISANAGAIKFWDLRSSSQKSSSEIRITLNCLIQGHNPHEIISGHEDAIRVWDIRKQTGSIKQLKIEKKDFLVTRMFLGKNPNEIIAARPSLDQPFRVYNLSIETLTKSFSAPKDAVLSQSLISTVLPEFKRNQIISASYTWPANDPKCLITLNSWDLTSGMHIKTQRCNHVTYALDYSPDHNELIAGDISGNLTHRKI